MLLLIAGMRRSASTLAYQIGCTLTGKYSGVRRIELLLPDAEGKPDWYVIKTHAFHPELIPGVEAGRIKVVITIRENARDMVVSIMSLNSDSFDSALQKVCWGIDWYKKWLASTDKVCVIRYEDFCDDLSIIIKRIGQEIDRQIDREEVERLAEEFSFENNKARSKTITKTEADFLFPGHIQDGIVGKWKTELSNDQVNEIQNRIGLEWFEENGYRE